MKLIAYCFHTFFLIMAFISCSKEDKITLNNENLKGVWFEENYLEEYNRISRLEYIFKKDNSLEILRKEIDKNSREILGYRYRTLGNYRLDGDQLSFNNLVSYSNDDTQGPYTEIENLQLVEESEGSSYTITCKFEESGKKLIFIYPPCGELANCIGSETLIKE
jgi:hypothetical protein